MQLLHCKWISWNNLNDKFYTKNIVLSNYQKIMIEFHSISKDSSINRTLTIPPAVHLPCSGQCQRVTIGTLGGWDLFHVFLIKERLLWHRAVVGISQTKPAIAALTTRSHRPITVDQERTELACLHLQNPTEIIDS